MGVAVDSSLIAEGTENVLVAGASLPGAIPWREGSGEGISLSTGFAAARTVLEREGAAAPA
jgi:anaerobic glycerol-3-phosphate dehydrogenase